MRSLHERISMEEATIFVLLLVGLQVQRIYTAEIDVISDSRFLTEEDTLVSPTGFFELGFFMPEGSKNKYVGIWYKKISVRTVAWVANRDLPVTGASSGTLKIVSPGNLVLMKDTNDVVWSSNTTSSGNATVQLEDSGNLVVRQGIGKRILWQSFDYPTDTLLPGMMLGRNFLTGKEWHLSSWKSSRDPAPGEFTWSVDTRGYPQNLLKQVETVAPSVSPSVSQKGRANIKIILPVVFLGVLLIGLSCTLFWYSWRKRNHAQPTRKGESLLVGESQGDALELPLFSFSTIATATDSFSPNNIIGEGGFGAVYKGMLEGLEIAVKRLSKTSSQGLDEFKNEVICISKLQHRNLVKLLGCSIQEDEKLLIYEYMSNGSLDSCIFDKARSMLLDWTARLNIINGIARGLLYLHQDSRLRIIHRDLKASNVLLDPDMNPKISDFGIARSFGGNETQANTERVVGTYGYMSPEYALDGVFSIKSDVFSFGVLVLEIVSGKRNRGFIHAEHGNNLIGHAWRMHNEGR
ncbi:hypothetical protein L2E82_25885 [Cichorium intybus]|uniref:Uncharacterized protein n=1 Tax=Cichorium intybus TaxID=13427 RepID=A0ACB9E5U6_CICIN|nr:hypothetical protein L2E82_25885 [Cichorium intybus]